MNFLSAHGSLMAAVSLTDATSTETSNSTTVTYFFHFGGVLGGGHSGKKAKILCRHQKYIFFAILDNSKNILEKRFFDQTSS
jgi:hypothetical protein